jgi:hypothetical protein
MRLPRTSGSWARRKRSPWRDCNAALQQEGTDLVDDAGTLADQARAYAMQRLQVQLIACFGSDELHGWSPDSFSDCFSIAEIVLLAF